MVGVDGRENVQPWLVGVTGLVEVLDGTLVTSAIGRFGAPETDLLSALRAGTDDGAKSGADGGSSADHFERVGGYEL